MLSRQATSSKSKDAESKPSSASTSKAQGQSSLSIPTSQSSSKLTRGEKRKANDSDPHDKQGSEYLRRKHNFIKASIRVDYQPDICKDYKETGFCGFGDSCKFLHDRSDYKHGWQLEQEWAKGEFKDEDEDKYLIKEDDDEDGGDDDTKNKCNVCNESYRDPIVTKCKHYFCSACADKECVDKCFICEKPTSGIFKVAKLDFLTKR